MVYSHNRVKWSESCSVVSNSLWPHGLYSPWISPGQNTGVGSLSFLQGIFPTQGSNLGLLHSRRILYQLIHKGSPRTLEWVAYPFSSRSSQPRNGTRVSCIVGRFFTSWAIRKALQQSIIQQQNKQNFERARIARGSPAVPALNCLSLPSLGPGHMGQEAFEVILAVATVSM